MDPTLVLLSRIHFFITIGFHILFPVLTIGLILYLVILEALWLVKRQELYYRQLRFWGRLFLLNFAIGVVTGVVMEFQFGTNWARFSQFAGGFFGNILGFEAAIAFAAESAFLGLMMFGWKRVSKGIHFFSTCMVAFAAVLSAFWIMDANSWMQHPSGVVVLNGRMEVVNYYQAIFNPFLWVSFFHKLIACIQTALLVVGGISAWRLLKEQHTGFFLRSFKISLLLGILAAPLQIITGDAIGRTVYRYQPEKGAAMDSHWETNPDGSGAAWSLVAWPDPQAQKNRFSIEIPAVLSILATHSYTGKVAGLREFPPDERPPVILPFYSFRLMVALGLFFFFLSLVSIVQWRRGRLTTAAIRENRPLLHMWAWSIPLGYMAMEAGWVVREVGRQPWSIYRLQRTAEGVSQVDSSAVFVSLLIYSCIYLILFAAFLLFSVKIISKGPDATSEAPSITDPSEQTDNR